MDRVEPELELIRRVLPFAVPAVLLALVAGGAAGGWNAGISAAIGVVVVVANLIVHAWSLSRAARISLTALYAAGLGGFILRLAAFAGILVALTRFDFFSPLAFVLAVIPATGVLIVFEMRQLRGRMQAELWNFSAGEPVRR